MPERPEDLADEYESLLVADPSGERKATGSYYTPPLLVDRLLATALDPLLDSITSESALLELRLCDPSCGAGNILLAATRRLAKRLASIRGTETDSLRDVLDQCIHGVDLDPTAVEICRATLSMAAGARVNALDRNIRCADSLLESFKPAGIFDVIVGNPPWVSYTGRQKVSIAPSHRQRLVERYPAIARWPAAHSAFLVLAARIAKPQGRIGLVLPKQVAEQEAYRAVRDEVDRLGFTLHSVEDAGESAFHGVSQAVGLFTFGGGERPANLIVDCGPLQPFLTQLEALPRFPPGTFFDQGVHTGNVSKKVILDELREEGDFAPIREGRDITAFHCGPPRKHVWLNAPLGEGEYCTIRPAEVYANTPILLRQTASRPIAALHTERTYFRNSLLGCRGVPGLPDAVLVACLNSALFAHLHRLNSQDANQRAFPQVKVRQLQKLPIPIDLVSKGQNVDILRRLSNLESWNERMIHLELAVLGLFDLPAGLAQPLLEKSR